MEIFTKLYLSLIEP